MAELTIEERKEILDRELKNYINQGWHIVFRNDTSAQLSRDIGVSCLVTLILAFFLILPAILYALFYHGTGLI